MQRGMPTIASDKAAPLPLPLDQLWNFKSGRKRIKWPNQANKGFLKKLQFSFISESSQQMIFTILV